MLHGTCDMNTTSPAKTERMFSAIAARYDLCNHLFSFGLDFYWRKKAAAMACAAPVGNALDLCCGTGDMAFALAKIGNVKTVCGCDISRPMLDIALRKTYRRKANKNCLAFSWLCAPAEQIELTANTFDLITCAFGLRNVDNLSLALKEMHRLLKPGGKVCILEFFLPRQNWLRKLYMIYLGTLMPRLGKLITGSSAPWDYLAQSIENWTDNVNLKQQLQAAGFTEITIQPLTCQTVQVYLAQKP
jgi:demethylmenaquinone methyltransferase / 2-methoxy-6-polyprenyl-1,4-benzoquinol methylase